MLHPHLNPKNGRSWVRPESLEAWENSKEKTIKLDVLAKLVAYHLEIDGRQAMTMDEDGQTLIVNTNAEADSNVYPEVDRIVIYSAFPSSNNALIDVSILIIFPTQLNISEFIRFAVSGTPRNLGRRNERHVDHEETTVSIGGFSKIDARSRTPRAHLVQRRSGRIEFGLCQYHDYGRTSLQILVHITLIHSIHKTGYNLVSIGRRTVEGADLSLPSTKASSLLSSDSAANSRRLPQQHLIRQRTIAQRLHQLGACHS